MLELKLVNGLASMYRAGLRLAIRSVKKRDELAVKAYHSKVNRNDALFNAAQKLLERAEQNVDVINTEYDTKARSLNAALNNLYNLQDDFKG